MARTENIHWHEGQYMQPHHLQMMQRQFLEQFAAERGFAFAYPYGLIDYQLSNDALQNLRVEFDRLHLVLPKSGLELIYPGNTELPSLNIRDAFNDLTGENDSLLIHVAVPLWQARRANAAEDVNGSGPRLPSLYRVQRVEQFDENTGASPVQVPVRRINARLVLDKDDREDVERMALFRIQRVPREETIRPRLRPDFVGPCLVINAFPPLKRLVADVADLVQVSRRELVPQLMREGFNRHVLKPHQVWQLLRLKTLNRFTAVLRHLSGTNGITPFRMYEELYDLLGQLTAEEPDRDNLFEIPPFDHENPMQALAGLQANIRVILEDVKPKQVMSLEFAPQGNLMLAQMTEPHFNEAERYFLAIKNIQDPDYLTLLVRDKDQFKFMARGMVQRPIRGVDLEPIYSTPEGLPNGPVYFRLDVTDRFSRERWDEIRRNGGAVAIKRPEGTLPGVAMTLYMPLKVK